jgi:hypothetical protein
VNKVAGVGWVNVSSCDFTATGGVLTDADCNTATRVVGAAVSGNDNYQMTVTNIPPGKYTVAAAGNFFAYSATGGTATACIFSISDGSTTIASSFGYSNKVLDTGAGAPSGLVEYTAFQPTKTFSVIATRAAGNGTCGCYNGATYPTAGFCGLTLTPLDQGLPLPNIIGSVISPIASGAKIVSADITTAGASASIVAQDGSWLSAITKTGTGAASMSIASGFFSAAPRCTCSPYGSGADNRHCKLYPNKPTTELVQTLVEQGTTANDDDTPIQIICVGAK